MLEVLFEIIRVIFAGGNLFMPLGHSLYIYMAGWHVCSCSPKLKGWKEILDDAKPSSKEHSTYPSKAVFDDHVNKHSECSVGHCRDDF